MNVAPAPGTILLGRYRVDGVLGIGGMGVVVRASHLELDTQVAIKLLLPHMVENPNVVQRFLREAQATVRLKGEHIAKVIDVGKMSDGAPFMVMEYLSGGDLGQVLKAHGAQISQVACELMLQICEGMSEAHAIGIVHRDVKPSNFFVTRRPDGSPLVKILDFGISKVPVGNDLQLTGTQSMVGTPSYMAPEHMRAANRADHRSDLWSMGVVLYQLLTDRLPFDGESYADLCLKVAMEPPAPIQIPMPPGLGEVLLRCLEKDPNLRFQSVAQLAYALAPFCSDPVVATAAAERCGRILEAPRGPRAPTLAVGSLGGAVALPLTPYSQTGNRPPLQSYPTSVSAGVGEVAPAPQRRSRMAIYGIGATLVLALGVGLGVFAAGSTDAPIEGASSPASIGAASSPSDPGATPSATESSATGSGSAPTSGAGSAATPSPTAPEVPAPLQGGAEPEPVPVAAAANPPASAPTAPTATGTPAKPDAPAKPTASETSGKPATPSPTAAESRPAVVEPTPGPGHQVTGDRTLDEAAKAKPKKKPKKKPDLFQSRE